MLTGSQRREGGPSAVGAKEGELWSLKRQERVTTAGRAEQANPPHLEEPRRVTSSWRGRDGSLLQEGR